MNILPNHLIVGLTEGSRRRGFEPILSALQAVNSKIERPPWAPTLPLKSRRLRHVSWAARNPNAIPNADLSEGMRELDASGLACGQACV
jgi:hypothetical protein